MDLGFSIWAMLGFAFAALGYDHANLWAANGFGFPRGEVHRAKSISASTAPMYCRCVVPCSSLDV